MIEKVLTYIVKQETTKETLQKIEEGIAFREDLAWKIAEYLYKYGLENDINYNNPDTVLDIYIDKYIEENMTDEIWEKCIYAALNKKNFSVKANEVYWQLCFAIIPKYITKVEAGEDRYEEAKQPLSGSQTQKAKFVSGGLPSLGKRR